MPTEDQDKTGELLGLLAAFEAGGMYDPSTNAVAKPNITGALSTVTDAAAKAVLTSIISCLTTHGLATNATT